MSEREQRRERKLEQKSAREQVNESNTAGHGDANETQSGGAARRGGMPGRGGMMGRGGMRGVVEKPKNFKATIVRLIGYCKSFLPAIIVALIATAAGTIFQIVGPDQLKVMTNEIMKGFTVPPGGMAAPVGINLEAVEQIGMRLVTLYLISLFLNFLQGLIMATVTQKISKRMRSSISQKINKMPLRYFDRTSYGDVLSRVTNDVDVIGMTLNQSLGTLISAGTMLVGSLIMMFYNNWIMTMTAVASSLLGFWLMTVIMKKSQKYFVIQQQELGSINGLIEEIYTGHHVVQAYNNSKAVRGEFEQINGKLYESAWKSQFLSGLMHPLMGFVGNLGYVAVCVVGALLSMRGVITFGVVVAFMVYIRFFTQPLSQLAQTFNNLQRTAAAGERVFEFLDEEELEDESGKDKRFGKISGNVEFRNVRFGYVPEKTIIHDFSATVRSGQRIAIVGPTGAGKTTMVNLLMRFYELDGGEILLDGIPISQVPREEVRKQFDMVLQDSWLFEGTIRDNIRYNLKDVSDKQIWDACKTVGLDNFIRALPDQYDTVLSDKSSLSEGQKQLVTIARAVIQDAPLLILDEATSSVDTRTERIVQAAMNKLTSGRTSFVIAHRLSTIRNADLILVMKDGDIIESGNHDELLSQNGFYAELYNSQFEAVPAA